MAEIASDSRLRLIRENENEPPRSLQRRRDCHHHHHHGAGVYFLPEQEWKESILSNGPGGFVRKSIMSHTIWPIIAIGSLQCCIAISAPADGIILESGPSKVHLLELFTSEGCSSCPPAEAWMSKLKQDSGLWREFVPIAFHVDYWDHLGWRDPFASKEWTARQEAYSARWHSSTVYTPGFVLDGNEWHQQELPRRAQETTGMLRLEVSGNDVLVTFKSSGNEARAYDVYLASLGSGLASEVNAGENRGRKLTHDFVVRSLQKASLPANATNVKLSIDKSRPEKTAALAVWITNPGDPTPIQAAGGWLP